MSRPQTLKVTYGLLVIFTTGTVLLRAQTTPAPSDGTSTGQRIGNIISAAVSTAFPAVSKIITAIWPNSGTNAVKPADATKSLQDAKTNAAKAQQPNVDGLTAAAKNLAVVRSFVTECGFASIQLASMQQLLAGRDNTQPLTQTEKDTLSAFWTPTGTRLKTLTADSVGTNIDGMKDNYLQATFLGIREAISNNSDNIKNQIDRGTPAPLATSVSALAQKVNGIGAATGLLIGDLSTSLTAAADNIAGKAGTTKAGKDATDDRKKNIDQLNTLYTKQLKQLQQAK